MNETNLISMKKFFASLILGLSILVLAPFGIMDAYAQSTLYGIASPGGGPGNPSTFYMINTNNGAGSPVGLIGFNACDSMEIDQSGTIYATCDRPGTNINVLITINPSTGAGTEVGPTGVDGVVGTVGGPKDMSFRNSDGTLFGYRWDCDEFGFSLMTFNLISGLATPIGGPGSCEAGNGLAFTPGDTLKVHHDGELFDVNQADGSLSNAVQTFLTSPAMDYNPDDGLLYAVDNPNSSPPRNLVTLNPANGQTKLIGQTVDRLTAIAFTPVQVVGGELLPIESTSLLLAGAQTFSWMIPVILSGIGIGLFVVSRKSE